MPDQDIAEFRPVPARTSAMSWMVAAVVACAAAAGAAWWFWLRPAGLPAVPPPVAGMPKDVPAAMAQPPMPEASGPQNPMDGLAPAEEALPPLAESDAYLAERIGELMGRGKVTDFLLTEGLVRRLVATVDNLGRAQAPSRMWPVKPMPERFTVEGLDGAQTIAASNASRYEAFLNFAEAVPMGPAVALYARLYPWFQQAYEELGYPRRYFNDRLVAVLDHLLLAPQPAGPLRVKLTAVNTELPDPQPWVRYEFADPALQALSSGQKILVRMGPANAVRAKALIREFRNRVATGDMARKPAR